jgi:hypothetical protein
MRFMAKHEVKNKVCKSSQNMNVISSDDSHLRNGLKPLKNEAKQALLYRVIFPYNAEVARIHWLEGRYVIFRIYTLPYRDGPVCTAS